MATEFPGPKCREMVDGGMMSWPCSLPVGHKGPHEAIEVPVSSRRRQMWLDEQEKIKAEAPPPAPVAKTAQSIQTDALGRIVAQAANPVLPASGINDEKQRIMSILNLLNKQEPSGLPSAVTSWVMGMLAQTSLLALWEMANREFQSGATGVVITPEYLERVVPQALRSYLGRD